MTDCESLRERHFAPESENLHDPEWTLHLESCAQCRLADQGLPLVELALAELGELPVSVPDFATIAEVAAGAAHSQRRRRTVRRAVPFFYTGLGAAALAAGLVVAVWIGRTQGACHGRRDPGHD